MSSSKHTVDTEESLPPFAGPVQVCFLCWQASSNSLCLLINSWQSNAVVRTAVHAYSINGSTGNILQQQSWQSDKAGPIISLLREELQGQWHEKLNRHLGHVLIKPYSHRKVWWSCDQCPEGFPHVWEAAVSKRSQGTGCPFCSGNAICQHNTLAQKAPEAALFWDAKKNHPVSPDQVTVFSNMRAHWKCNACLHE